MLPKLLFHFNSIKVRLKPQGLTAGTNLSVFQFHKGTIKTSVLFPITPLLLNFNSIKVRLKLTAGTNLTVGYSFQFHKGTIKTS